MSWILMSDYLLDSYAWIEYFLGSELGLEVRDILEKEGNKCFTSALSVSEVTVKFKKLGLDFDKAFNSMKKLSTILSVNENTAFEAGKLYVEKRKAVKDIGMVDIVIITQAREGNLKIVTGDIEHFKDEKNVMLI